jgi:hypothetical protein
VAATIRQLTYFSRLRRAAYDADPACPGGNGPGPAPGARRVNAARAARMKSSSTAGARGSAARNARRSPPSVHVGGSG